MPLIFIISILILHCQSVLSSTYYNEFNYLRRNAYSEKYYGIKPIVKLDNEPFQLSKTATFYDFKFEFEPKEISALAVDSGPFRFGCFIGSSEPPYRSRFIGVGESLEQPFPHAEFIHCYALEYPKRDVVIDVMNTEKMRTTIVVDPRKKFRSLFIPSHYSDITSIALVEEQELELVCQLELSRGRYYYLDWYSPEINFVTGARAIGCIRSDSNVPYNYL